MAVDTPTKRASALNVRTRCRRFLPVPDGTIDVADRAHLAAVYYEVAVAVTPSYSGGWIAETRQKVLIPETRSRVWIAGKK